MMSTVLLFGPKTWSAAWRYWWVTDSHCSKYAVVIVWEVFSLCSIVECKARNPLIWAGWLEIAGNISGPSTFSVHYGAAGKFGGCGIYCFLMSIETWQSAWIHLDNIFLKNPKQVLSYLEKRITSRNQKKIPKTKISEVKMNYASTLYFNLKHNAFEVYQ